MDKDTKSGQFIIEFDAVGLLEAGTKLETIFTATEQFLLRLLKKMTFLSFARGGCRRGGHSVWRCVWLGKGGGGV